MSFEGPQDAWRVLRQGGHVASGSEIPSVLAGVKADAGPVRYALGAKGEGRLLLPLSASERVPKIPQTPTLKVIDAIYTFGGQSWRFIDLTCLAAELDGVFAEVAAEIVTRISDGYGALKACVSTLSEFRLLLVPGQSKVGPQEIVGLVGELVLLNDLLDFSPSACSLWRGPLGERHDFRGGNLAIEVKTTSRAANESMRVTSVDQLLEPTDGELVVARYTLEQASGGRLSVADLFRRAAGVAADPLLLRNLLAQIGCADPLSEEWNIAAFELQETRMYRVQEGFPRVIPASFTLGALPTGVSELSYAVDLKTASSFLLRADEPTDFKTRMLACLPA